MIIRLILVLVGLVLLRLLIRGKRHEAVKEEMTTGSAFYIGNKEIQADAGQIAETPAGMLAVLADGIGRDKLGRASARIAVEAVVSLFTGYEAVSNLPYFFKRAFSLANHEVLKIMEGRKGGASMAAAIITDKRLYYALAGDIRIALLRRRELIPLSEGQTLDALASRAYQKGKLTKQKTIWAMQEKRIWNYVGQDGFRELEIIEIPVLLKTGDRIVLMTKGIYDGMPWKEIEQILKESTISSEEAACRVVDRLVGKPDVDNASILIITVYGSRYEED